MKIFLNPALLNPALLNPARLSPALRSLTARRRRPIAAPATANGDVAAPDGVRFVPGEVVLLLTVELPRMSAAQRSTAIAFAVEDHIARPLDEVHVALGPELGSGRWLVGVIARNAQPKDLPPGTRLLPDTLALPVPAAGQWSVRESAGRVLIRLADGTGLVTRLPGLPVLHQTAGQPPVVLYAGSVPLEHTTAPLPPPVLPAGFDLAISQSRTLALPPLMRNLAAIALLAACGHLAILAADTYALARADAALAASLRIAANAAPDADINTLLARILTAPQTAADTGLLPLLAATFDAIAPQSGTVSIRDLRFAAAQNSLTLTAEAADLGALQQVETSLAAAGLRVVAGAAISANGTAEQQLTLQGTSP